MALNHSSVVTHAPPSLPSFAQAFSNRSLSNISSHDNSLPPIQSRLIPAESLGVTSPTRPNNPNRSLLQDATKKRTRDDITTSCHVGDHHSSDLAQQVHIKEEERDVPQITPPPTTRPSENGNESSPTLPPKKRRVTVSGALHQLNTDVSPHNEQTSTTPISPVVMGFTIQRDNPSAIEQVKSMITIKQKQKALIEQRRGSGVLLPSPTTSALNLTSSAFTQDRGQLPMKLLPSTRSVRRSPNRRHGGHISHTSTRPSSPPFPSVSLTGSGHQQIVAPMSVTSVQSFPPLPISFARRRAEQLGKGKKKPADLLLGPRNAHLTDQFQPAVQSAPPVQTSFSSARFPMTIPSLPSAIGSENPRRVAGNVPPTPTRFYVQQNREKSISNSLPSISGRSPQSTLPNASTLVPPTPSFQQSSISVDKAAFLAPFEVFYDALHDSKQLKTWLGDQLHRSNALIQVLNQQQDKIDELIAGIVDKKVAGMQNELDNLRQRVFQLEDTLHASRGGSPPIDEDNSTNVGDSSHPSNTSVAPRMQHEIASLNNEDENRLGTSLLGYQSLQPIEISVFRPESSQQSPGGCLELPENVSQSQCSSRKPEDGPGLNRQHLGQRTTHVEKLAPTVLPLRRGDSGSNPNISPPNLTSDSC